MPCISGCGTCGEGTCACSYRCGKCCCRNYGHELVLTPDEIWMLLLLAEIPFLPVARQRDSETPVFLEAQDKPKEEYSNILLWLNMKGLISLDYDMPLSNFDYGAYEAYPIQGSMALTKAGQAVIELLERQGTT